MSRGSVWQQLLCTWLWEAAEALSTSPQPLQAFQHHWINSQPWHSQQWCLLKSGQAHWPLHLLKERDVTISSMRLTRKKAIKQQNSCGKCCWEGYSLSIPARKRHSGFVFFSSSWKNRSGKGSHRLPCDAGHGKEGRMELQQAVCAAKSRSK